MRTVGMEKSILLSCQPMNYQRILPIPALQRYVRYFGVLESDDAGASKSYGVIADGCPGLIFQENPDAFLDHSGNVLPQLFLHGLTTKHSGKTAKGSFRNIGVYFQPHAIKAIFGTDAFELTNQYVDLQALVKNDLASQLLEAASTEKKIQILSLFLCDRLDQNKHRENPRIAWTLERIIKQGAETSLTEIQAELNLSERSLERIFKTDIGLSPKLFTRITRFQSSLNHLRSQKFDSLTDVALSNLFYDQSHYIREFKEFAGVTPKQFLRQAHEQAVNFPEWRA